MQEYNAQQVRDCYNRTAKEYAEQFLHELDHKPFDCNLLNRFSDMLPAGGAIYDFGCGSGQTTSYVSRIGRQKVVGLDFSESAVQLAKQNFRQIEFIVDDMLASKIDSSSADGILAFYAVVHFGYSEIEQALKEWLRLLKPGGFSLFSFHVGEETFPITDFLGVSGANATWRFLNPDRVLEIAERVGFKITEAVIRYPYHGSEHPSKRAYILLQKMG